MSGQPTDLSARRRAAAVGGHRGDDATILAALDDPDASVRGIALGALARTGTLSDDQVRHALFDPEPEVRRRACELASARPRVSLLAALHDHDSSVVEVAAWACGEQCEHDEAVDGDVLRRLMELTTTADDPLVREACAAALGAIGDERGLPAILAACDDKPHVRRRAVLALAPFDGDDVDAAIDRALADRDWQVRQAAEDLRRASGPAEL